MRSWKAPVFFFWLLLLGTLNAQPLELKFSLTVTTTQEEAEDEVTKQSLVVVLDEETLDYRVDGSRRFLNFETKRQYQASDDGVREASLYTDVGFRALELPNRLMLSQALNSAGLEVPPSVMQGPVMAEHLFAMDAPKSEAEPAKDSGRWIYGENLLFEASEKGKALEAAQSREFVRFLRYYGGGHPVILDELEKASRVPEKFTLVIYNMARTRRIDFALESLKFLDTKLQPPSGEKATAEGKFEPLIVATSQIPPSEIEKKWDELLQEALDSAEQGEAFQSFLAFNEYHLASGNPIDEFVSKRSDLYSGNPDLQKMARALRQGAPESLEVFEELKPAAGPRAHILTIFQASHLLEARELPEAQAKYLQALETNPTITGAWKDLADVSYGMFEAELAWQCWDLARKLAPNHGMLEQINSYEKMLEERYPGFF